MDLEKIRKLAEKEAQSYAIAKAITQIKNEVKDRETGRDVSMSDYFKTLREPLLKAQKKNDEKQDKVIKQLAKNQLALTSGLQDIASLQELPQIEGSSEAVATERKSELPVVYDLSKTFDSSELEWLEKNHSLANPNYLIKMIPQKFEENEKTYKEVSRFIGDLKRSNTGEITKKNDEIRQLSLKSPKSQKKFEDKVKELKIKEDSLNIERNVLLTFFGFLKDVNSKQHLKVKKDRSRNALKIQSDQFGRLFIDVPRLLSSLEVLGFRGGQ